MSKEKLTARDDTDDCYIDEEYIEYLVTEANKDRDPSPEENMLAAYEAEEEAYSRRVDEARAIVAEAPAVLRRLAEALELVTETDAAWAKAHGTSAGRPGPLPFEAASIMNA